MEDIYIVFNIDHNFVRHCASTMLSIKKNYCGNQNIIFYIIHEKLSEKDQQDLQNVITSDKFEVTFLNINSQLLNTMPLEGNTINTTITISTYFRLFLAMILPESISKVIYLDADIYVNCSIDQLWSINISDYAIAGVPDVGVYEKMKHLNIPKSFSYVNAGVSIMNLKYLRSIKYPLLAIKFAKDHKDQIRYHDQDIQNALLYDKTLLLPFKWNMMDAYLFTNPPVNSKKDKKELEDWMVKPYIIHFAGYLKPWHKECQNPYRKLYWSVLSGTKWKKDKPKYREQNFIKEIKLLIRLAYSPNKYFKK